MSRGVAKLPVAGAASLPRRSVRKIGFVYDAVYPHVRGGVEKRVWEIARRLVEAGLEVHLFGVKFWSGPETITRCGVILHGICGPTPFYTRSGRRSIRQAIRFAAALPRSLDSCQLDVVDSQASSPLACLTAWLHTRRRRIPLVVTWHEVWGSYWVDYLGVMGRVGQIVEWLCGRLTRHHVAVSEHTRRRMSDMLGIQDATMVSNGVDMHLVDQTGASGDQSDILFLGRLVRQKNPCLLLDALAELQSRGLRPRTLVAGEGPERQRVVERASELGLQDIRFISELGSETDVVAVMKASRVFALPSTHEGFSLVALEANACGLPVVAVDSPASAASEVVGSAGALVGDNPVDFADALERLLTNESVRSEMSGEAIRRARESDWDEIVDRLGDVYEEVSHLYHS